MSLTISGIVLALTLTLNPTPPPTICDGVGACHQLWRLSYGNMDLWLQEIDWLFREIDNQAELARMQNLHTLSHQAQVAPHTHVRPQSSNTGMGTNVEQWRPLVSATFGDLGPPAINTALCLMKYESGGNPSAKNPNSSARGLMQILASLWAPVYNLTYDDLYNPDINLWVARQVYNQSGWYAWSPYNRGLCRA